MKPDPHDISSHPEIDAKIKEEIPINASMGIGLPMTKVYANYWGGNVSLYSMCGFGTDVYCTISTGGLNSENFQYTE